jgi:lipopolysaccharide/colanic/teichoic acid biosynthesis glycosyltransferase
MSTALSAAPVAPRSISRIALNPRSASQRASRQALRPASVIPVRPEYALKPVLDYSLAAVIAVIALPVMLVAAALVKVTSPGPAIYSQTRVGRGGKTFTIYKFRSMRHDCERLTGPQWSTGKDSRVTTVGRILRALHIDELPQLWNVFRGEMSLIGPRPERPEIVADLRRNVFGYDIRHQVKPGITGFAQVHLPPDSCLQTVKNKLIYDRFYLTRMSLVRDLSILVCTGLKVVGLRGLYRRAPRKEVL